MTTTSSERQKRRSCTRKAPFQTLLSADRAASRATARTGELILAYECKFCGYFHIGHLPIQKHETGSTQQLSIKEYKP